MNPDQVHLSLLEAANFPPWDLRVNMRATIRYSM